MLDVRVLMVDLCFKANLFACRAHRGSGTTLSMQRQGGHLATKDSNVRGSKRPSQVPHRRHFIRLCMHRARTASPASILLALKVAAVDGCAKIARRAGSARMVRGGMLALVAASTRLQRERSLAPRCSPGRTKNLKLEPRLLHLRLFLVLL